VKTANQVSSTFSYFLSLRSKHSFSSHFSLYERPSFMPVRNKVFSAHTNNVIVNSNLSSPLVTNPVILKSCGVLPTTNFQLSNAYFNITSPHSARTFFQVIFHQNFIRLCCLAPPLPSHNCTA